jgi:hypothetical protein
MPGDRSDNKSFGDGPLSDYRRPAPLRTLDTLLGVFLLALLGYTGYKGYWEVFVLVLALAVVCARRDMILGYRVGDQDDA